jgi:NAD dependent epimerase/dehydratase family enzyme
MGVVAVAGGTGDVGRTITEQLAESGKHTVYILSRKVLSTKVYNSSRKRYSLKLS